MNGNGGPWYRNPGWWLLAFVIFAHIAMTEYRLSKVDQQVDAVREKIEQLRERAILRDK